MSRPVTAARSERPVIGWATALLLASVLPQYLIGALAVEMRSDFRFSDAQLGVAVGISFAISAVVAPMAGRTVRWIGVRRGVVLTAALVTVSSVAIGSAQDATTVIVLMGFVGLAGGVGSPCLSSLLAEEVGTARHGTAFGLFSSAPQFAAFAAGLALPVVAAPLDWRVAFVAPAVLGVASLVALARLGMPATTRRAAPDAAGALRLPSSVRVMALSTALASAAGLAMRSFLVVFAVSIGFSNSAAGLVLALTGLVAIVSRIVFGVLGDRRPGRPLYRAAGLMAISAFGFVLMAAGGSVPIVLGAVLAGGLGWGWQAPMTLAVVSLNREATAAAVGLQMAGFFAGAVVGPAVLGVFTERGSYTTAWVACVGLSCAAAGGALLAHRMSRRLVT